MLRKPALRIAKPLGGIDFMLIREKIMKISALTTSIVVLVFLSINLYGQNKIGEGLKLWESGEVLEAYNITEKILKSSPQNDAAIFLKVKSLFVQGKYAKSIETFRTLKPSFGKYSDAVDLAVEAYLHLKDYENAWKLAAKSKLERTPYLEERKKRPFKVIAEKTYIVPFLDDIQLPSSFWPAVNGKINAEKVAIRFDTGGTFLVMGKGAAEKLGIGLKYKRNGMHGSSEVIMWDAIADSMGFERGPHFQNVPVVIMEDLGDRIIFGTNILEQFLTTIDYTNNRFIFTPRNRHDLYEQHYKLLPTNMVRVSFYLWGDHYMIAKGKFGDHDDLNLFFDSGLIALTVIDGKMRQASFTASKESLVKWGFDKSKLTESGFSLTKYTLEVGGLSQPNTLVWYDHKLEKDRNFGGIRIDGLISNAWFKKYSWTIDFDKHGFIFGTKQ